MSFYHQARTPRDWLLRARSGRRGSPIYFIHSLPIDRRVQLGAEASHEGSFRYQAARRWKRMPEEKTQHFPRCVRSPRIRVGARRATSRPRVGGAVDIPMLQDFASARVGMGRTGVVMASRYLPAMHRFLRARRTDGLFKNLTAIVWMHGGVAVAVKNNCRDRRPVAGNDLCDWIRRLAAWRQMRRACQWRPRRRGRNGSRPPHTDRYRLLP